MAVVAALVALVGCAMVAVGVGLWSFPAGLVVGGVELVAAVYVATYYAARKGAA
jgi:hypothetical protein